MLGAGKVGNKKCRGLRRNLAEWVNGRMVGVTRLAGYISYSNHPDAYSPRLAHRELKPVIHRWQPGQQLPYTDRYEPAFASIGPLLLPRGCCRYREKGRFLGEQSKDRSRLRSF